MPAAIRFSLVILVLMLVMLAGTTMFCFAQEGAVEEAADVPPADRD